MEWHLIMVMIRSEAEVKDLLHVHDVQHVFCEGLTTSSTLKCTVIYLFPTEKAKYRLAFFLGSIYLFLALMGLHNCMDFSLVAMTGGCSPVVVCRLLNVAASLVAEHRL